MKYYSILYFLEISLPRDFILRPSLVQQQFEGGIYERTCIRHFNNKPICMHIPYSGKYWQELNLAVGPQTVIAKILADLAVG